MLDFVHEAENARRAQSHLRYRKDIHIPEIIDVSSLYITNKW